MPPSINPPEIDQYGRFRSEGGLIVPDTYLRSPVAGTVTHLERLIDSHVGFSQGLALPRDEDTLAARWPMKGGGWDDLTAQAIVDGMIANAGASPVIAPQISAMVRRQQNQSMSATIDVTGRATPMNKARDAIAMFNDSPLGVTDALELMTYRLCTYNRGSPVSTVPIIYAFEAWEEYGLTAHPILRPNQKEANATKYWLEVDWGKFGTPVPFLPHPFDLEGTGNPEWPYWYRAKREDQNKRPVWVLLHSSQIVPVVPGKSSRAGVGLSPVWMCLGYLAEQILINDERVEKMLYSLTDGIILLGGVDEIKPDAILNKIEAGRSEALKKGFSVAKGTTLIASPLNQVSVAQVTLRQPPGMEFEAWRHWAEDIIAFAFGEPLSAMVSRGKVGFGASASVNSDNASETGIGAHLSRIGNALGSIYPRVSITVTRSNDRAARLNMDTLAKFMPAAQIMITNGVAAPDQIAKIIDRDILLIPEPGELTAEANAGDDTGATQTGDGGANDPSTPQASQGGAKPVPAPAAPAPSGKATQQSAQEAEASWPRQVSVRDPALDVGNPFMPEWMRRDYAKQVAILELREALATLDALDTLVDQGGVKVTDDDVDAAIKLARERVGDDVADLLGAEQVEE